MRPPSLAVATVSLAFLTNCGRVAAASIPESSDSFLSAKNSALVRRDGGGHHHGDPQAQPLTVLNETEILRFHQPTPPSYYTFDWEGDAETSTHPRFMLAHIVFMSLAFFAALPAGIILRSLRHPAHSVATISFYALSTLGISSSSIYRKVTPNLYKGSVHGKHGYLIMLVAILLSGLDIVQGVQRLISFVGSNNKSLKRLWQFVFLNQESKAGLEPEYAGLIVDDPEELEYDKLQERDTAQEHTSVEEHTEWTNDIRWHRRMPSDLSERTMFGRSHSDGTLNESVRGTSKKQRWMQWIGQTAFSVVESSLVIAGFVQLLTGIVIYTGGCRQNWINGCLAHLIKGGIFWCYGLLTFARFLGAFAERGWAWNRAPKGFKYSAEFIESLLIFLYGSTNTWMERFGAKPGDPFTTKQIQHISIAVMFCFAGLVGMGIESRRVRRWLASSTFASVGRQADMPQDAVMEPPSYLGSFNPFPALVIGVTGAAMAAHFQTYLFQVQIHSLWGNLLVGFSVLRCLTYFFLWLSPPKSILPSRPPTEVLGSFFLACGGLVFMFSTEEVTIAAMRRGRDDVMMFLNVAVAITCLAFCWTLCVVGLKGYLKFRTHPDVTYRSDHT